MRLLYTRRWGKANKSSPGSDTSHVKLPINEVMNHISQGGSVPNQSRFNICPPQANIKSSPFWDASRIKTALLRS